MKKTVLVSGSKGLTGSAIKRLSVNYPQYNWFFADRSHGDLRNRGSVAELFLLVKPDYVIHTSALVGGIGLNLAKPADLYYDNIVMNANIVDVSAKLGVEKLICFSSICAFPDKVVPLDETKLHEGQVFEANRAYGVTKRAISTHLEAVMKQYGLKNYTWIASGNIFGENDSFNLENSHIVPALIRKIYEAKRDNKDFVIWGNGEAQREFLYIDDTARVVSDLLGMDELPDGLLVCGQVEWKIRDLVLTLVDVADFDGKIIFDETKPNGQLSRPSSKERFNKYFPDFKYTSIRDGLERTWKWFCENYPNVRL